MNKLENAIDVWNVKKGMILFEDNSFVSSAGYIIILEDAKASEDNPKYFTAPVRRDDGFEYTIGAHQDYSHYGPQLYLLEEQK